jgi:hypothetical protein
MRKPRTKKSEIAFSFCIFNDKHIEHHVDDPKRNEGGNYPFREFRFKPCTLRITETDSDGLKCTQERGSAHGKTPGNSG